MKRDSAPMATPKPEPVTPSLDGVRALGEALHAITVDQYLVKHMWPVWREHGYQVCNKCGYSIIPTTGLCAGNSTHVAEPYNHRSLVSVITLG